MSISKIVKWGSIVFAIFSSPLIIVAQQQIKIGEKCPDVSMQMINYAKPSVKISDFKGKLLILDFWATWCGPCVAGFEKLDHLQKKFKDKVQILPVTYEDKIKTQSLLDKLKEVKQIHAPSAINDSILSSYFWHSEVPFYVWINGEGNVIAMSNSNDVTAEKIEQVLTNEKDVTFNNLNYRHQPDINQPFFNPTINLYDKNGELVKSEQISKKSLLFTSTFAGYNENGIPGLYGGGDDHRITMENISINVLYDRAFSNKMLPNENLSFGTDPNRIIWEVKDTTLLILSNKYADDHILKGNLVLFKEWIKRYGFCYEVQTPESWGPDMKYEIMVNDLNRYFGALYGIKGSFEKRKVKGLALVKTSKNDKLTTTNGTPSVNRNPYSLSIQNMPVSIFSRFLGADYLRTTVTDKTGIEGNVDMDINIESPTIDIVNTELKKYDLKLIENTELQNIIVIRQVGQNNAVFTPLDQNYPKIQ